MLPLLIQAAPALLQAGQAGFSALQGNNQATEEYNAQVEQAKQQIELNKEAAADSYYAAQTNLNNKIRSAAMKREDMLVKLTQARGSFAAQEGRSGKSNKRVADISTFGNWGRDSNRLTESVVSAAKATEAEMGKTAMQTFRANQLAISKIKPLATQSVGMAVLGSLAKSGLSALKGMAPDVGGGGKGNPLAGLDGAKIEPFDASKVEWGAGASPAFSFNDGLSLGDFDWRKK